jgi:DNA-binding PucR family transcriptional regulator
MCILHSTNEVLDMVASNKLASDAVQMERIYQLLRQGAEKALTLISQDEVIDRMEKAGMAGTGDTTGQDDPSLMASTRRSIRSSTIHWLNSTIENPSRNVEPFVSENILQSAIVMQELGIPELMLTLDRAAQNIAWEYWMDVAFEITENSKELKRLLDVSFKSISSYIDGSRDLLSEMLKDYNDKNPTKHAAKKRDLVLQILDGNSAPLEKSIERLGYPMDVQHCAAIVWGEEGNTEISVLEKAAEFFAQVCGQGNPLTVMMSGEVAWVWTTASRPIEEYPLQNFFKKLPGVRMTYASGGKGVEGFRKAHLDALSTQRVLGRLRSTAQVVGFESIRLAEILSRDPEATNSFISTILGSLKYALPELKASLLTYIECGCNANKAAQELHTHRNTLVRRLARAEELLPKPLSENLVQVAAALEMDKWLV